jgi:hypothetical protein
MPVTAKMPMKIPSIVSTERSLLARIAFSAMSSPSFTSCMKYIVLTLNVERSETSHSISF